MSKYPFRRLALAAAVSVAAMSQAMSPASAGGCCNCGAPCFAPGQYLPVLQVPNVAVVTPYYVVNQGPIYSGPGIVIYPSYYEGYRPVGVYPNEAADYYVPPYYVPPYYGWVGMRPAKRIRVYR